MTCRCGGGWDMPCECGVAEAEQAEMDAEHESQFEAYLNSPESAEQESSTLHGSKP